MFNKINNLNKNKTNKNLKNQIIPKLQNNN